MKPPIHRPAAVLVIDRDIELEAFRDTALLIICFILRSSCCHVSMAFSLFAWNNSEVLFFKIYRFH